MKTSSKALTTLLAAASLFIAPVALATYYSTSYQYGVAFDFSPVAWNKPVKVVYAHTGVLEKRHDLATGETETYWSDIQHLPLHLQGGRLRRRGAGPRRNRRRRW